VYTCCRQEGIVRGVVKNQMQRDTLNMPCYKNSLKLINCTFTTLNNLLELLESQRLTHACRKVESV